MVQLMMMEGVALRRRVEQMTKARRPHQIHQLRGRDSASIGHYCLCTCTISDSVYQELGDGQVLEMMEKHVSHYSVHCARQTQDSISPVSDLILFQRAMEHAARLCRIMVSWMMDGADSEVCVCVGRSFLAAMPSFWE